MKKKEKNSNLARSAVSRDDGAFVTHVHLGLSPPEGRHAVGSVADPTGLIDPSDSAAPREEDQQI